jgi:hypothetical protein
MLQSAMSGSIRIRLNLISLRVNSGTDEILGLKTIPARNGAMIMNWNRRNRR